MDVHLILYPLALQISLTLVVWFYMVFERLREIKIKRAKVSKLANPEYESAIFVDSIHSSDNFENLFEMPVLFYVAILTLIILNKVDSCYVALSWLFVSFRIIHSFIHCGYNNIRHRFGAYVISSFFLCVLCIRLIFQVFGL